MKKLLLIFTALCFSLPLIAKEKYSCDDPVPYCKEMISCEQARFYLDQCSAYRLDRDRDGVPCENVCGKGKRK